MASSRDMYLSLLENAILDTLYESFVSSEQTWDSTRAGKTASQQEISEGKYWPARAHSMIGRKRLKNIRTLLEDVIAKSTPGDFVETGVWRGGASIFAKGVLMAHEANTKKVFVADSFQGLPKPDSRYPADQQDEHWEVEFLQVSRSEVERNFEAYDLLDDNVVFLEGFFEDTLPTAPIDEIAILRLDGDMYSSTIQALNALYDKVVPGGYVIVDDYALPTCKEAVNDFRAEHDIVDIIHEIDWTGVYWQKTG